MMQYPTRWLGLARAGLACTAAVATALVASPARAADDPFVTADYLGPATVGGTGSPGKAVQFLLHVGGAEQAKLELDLTDLDGLLTAHPLTDACTAADQLVTCDLSGLGDVEGVFTPVTLVPDDGVTAGQSGELTWTTSAANVEAVSQSTTVMVADGVDLVVTSSGQVFNGIKPGETVAIPITGANLGNEATPAILLTVIGFARVELAQYENCTYSATFDLPVAVCLLEIDGGLAPGDGFEVDGGFEVVPAADALAKHVLYTIAPEGPLPQLLAGELHQGSGNPLQARNVGATIGAQTVDIDESDNVGDAELNVENTADLAAKGATVTGAVGDVVPVTLGVTNLGPATLENLSGEATSRYVFTVPPGTQIVAVPEGCSRPQDPDPAVPPDFTVPPPGLPAYWCYSDFLLTAGDAYTHVFSLKITDAIANAEGSVQAIASDGSATLPFDANPANNTATVWSTRSRVAATCCR